MKNIPWTSWYCPVKECEVIVYNTNGLRNKIYSHLKTHGLMEDLSFEYTTTDQELPKTG